MKRQSTKWEQIFANNDHGLVCRTYKELLRLDDEKTNSPVEKAAEGLNRCIFKEGVCANGQGTRGKMLGPQSPGRGTRGAVWELRGVGPSRVLARMWTVRAPHAAAGVQVWLPRGLVWLNVALS